MLKERKHKIIVSLLYLVLLGIFIRYYFLGIFQEYLKGSTTFSSRTQEAEYLNGPQITLCFEPSYKPSVMDSNELKDEPSFAYFMNFNDSWRKYQEFAYQLNTNIFFDLQLIMNASISKQYQKAHCLKITENVAFKFLNFSIFIKFFFVLTVARLVTLFCCKLQGFKNLQN